MNSGSVEEVVYYLMDEHGTHGHVEVDYIREIVTLAAPKLRDAEKARIVELMKIEIADEEHRPGGHNAEFLAGMRFMVQLLADSGSPLDASGQEPIAVIWQTP